MSIWVLANSVADKAAQVVATDLTPTAVASQGAVNSIRGGPRHLKWTSDHATAARRLSYVNTRANLTANFAVIVDAFAHIGKVQKIISSATYSSVETELDSRTLQASDMVGIGGSDFVFPFVTRLENRQAFSVSYTSTDYEKTARQVYFADAIEFDQMPSNATISITRLPIHNPPVKYGCSHYHLWGIASLPFEHVTRATLDAFLELPQDDPIFLYDDTGGKAIPEALWHCIILDTRVSPILDDYHGLTIDVGILRDWRA